MRSPLRVVTALALVVLVLETAYLAQENAALRHALSTVRRALEGGAGLTSGWSVPEFAATTPSGEPTEIGFRHGLSATVLCVLSADCPYCVTALGEWNRLFLDRQGTSKVIGVSLSGVEETRAFVARHNVLFPVVIPNSSPEFVASYRIRGTPTTLEVAPNGEVISEQAEVPGELLTPPER